MTDDAATPGPVGRGTILTFGPYRLLQAERRVETDAGPLKLSSRGFDILVALAERPSDVVSKLDLMARAWPGLLVNEDSLRFHIAALRKALGEAKPGTSYIKNVSGRGYCLVVPVSRSAVADQPFTAAGHHWADSLAIGSIRAIGRDQDAADIAAMVAVERIVTVCGTGGVGKTAAVVAACHRLSASFDGAIRFIDLTQAGDAAGLPGAVAAGLGLGRPPGDPCRDVIGALRGRRLLLVLDGCEHVVDAAAHLVERIVRETAAVHVLTTSREALRAEGEHVYGLLPLACPPAAASLDAGEAMAFPAVQLFAERAAAGEVGFQLSDADAPAAGELCRRLDGLPLAIELAAGRVSAYGIHGLASLIDLRFNLAWHGRRTASPRHQTLTASLDWSYRLLTAAERLVLAGLSVFTGRFSLDAAQAVAGGEDTCAGHVIEAVAGLVAKSLVAAGPCGDGGRYRLSEVTRSYMRQKLQAGGAHAATARRHALYCCRMLEHLNTAGMERPKACRAAAYAGYAGEVRAALRWCLSAEGDNDAGIALATAAIPMVLDLSLVTECNSWMAAVAALDPSGVGGCAACVAKPAPAASEPGDASGTGLSCAAGEAVPGVGLAPAHEWFGEGVHEGWPSSHGHWLPGKGS